MTRYIKRGGKIWIRIFPHTPVSRKTQDVKMGSGKGNPEFYAAKVKPGTVLFDMHFFSLYFSLYSILLSALKFPLTSKFLLIYYSYFY